MQPALWAHSFIHLYSFTDYISVPAQACARGQGHRDELDRSLTSEASRMMEETDLNADNDSKADVDRGSWETEEG